MNCSDVKKFLEELNIYYPKIKFSDSHVENYIDFVDRLTYREDEIYVKAFPQIWINSDTGQYVEDDSGVYIFLYTRKGFALTAFLDAVFETNISTSLDGDKPLRWNYIIQKEKYEGSSETQKVLYLQVGGILPGNFVFKAKDHPGAVLFFNKLYFSLTPNKLFPPKPRLIT